MTCPLKSLSRYRWVARKNNILIMIHTPKQLRAFTLIELSIVLVIIGLIVSGVLVGRNLILAAEARSQIAQIESYQVATNTFRQKYGYLPGDIPDPDATNFAFVARGSGTGQGDGNGVIEAGSYASYAGVHPGLGEHLVFWVDLSTAKLIPENFKFSASEWSTAVTALSLSAVNQYWPAAKIGQGNFIFTLSPESKNNFVLSRTAHISGGGSPDLYAGGIPVIQAYNIDSKVDDGLPGTGSVQAWSYFHDSLFVYQWTDTGSGANSATIPTYSKAATNNTCTDNSATAGVAWRYSVNQNSGSGANCSLAFKFQ